MVEPITVDRYETVLGEEAYSVKYRDLSILVTPPGRTGPRTWAVWYSDSLRSLLAAKDEQAGIAWAMRVLGQARNRTPAASEAELNEGRQD